MNYRWYLFAEMVFAVGAVIGAAFLFSGPEHVVRTLGALTVAFSLAGAAISLWTFRADDPWKWELYRFRIAMFLRLTGEAIQTLARPRRTNFE